MRFIDFAFPVSVFRRGCIAAFCVAIVSASLSAGTIISVTGPTAGAGLGIFPDQTVAIPFTVGQSYSGVSITPDLDGSFSGTAYLVTQIGAGTTIADEIASGPFTSTGVGFQTVLSNVSIGPGNYFIVLSTAQDTPPQGIEATNSPATVADAGASTPLGFYITSTTGGAFAPADTFGPLNTQFALEFTVVGTPVASTPEPATWILLGAGLASLVSLRKMKSSVARCGI